MSYPKRKSSGRLWEYGWYLVVTFGLLLVGGILVTATAAAQLVKKMRKSITTGLTVILVLAAVAIAWWTYVGDSELPEEQTVTVMIESGDGFSTISDRLAAGGVIRFESALKLAARLRGVDRQLVPGRYDFTGCNSVRSVLDRLGAGDFLRIKVTLPEGTTIWGTASILARRLELDSAAIVALDTDPSFLTEIHRPCLEGYLFPETYHLPWGISEREAAATLVQMFDRQTRSIWKDSISGGFSRYEIVKLASIIEAETSRDEERPLVASVYRNRLRDNWRLDADPTVIYGLGGLNRPLYVKDLRRDTPYNTYMRKGLPPTPINSPGLASILAALHPEESDYFFFVADETGGHYFSRTNAEHERAKRRIRNNSAR